MNLWRRLISTTAPRSVVLIRILVGGVFLAEGVQKLLYPNEVGAGRFAKIVIPNPDLMGPFVGVVEILCGSLILVGLFTRGAAIPLMINMLVAILSTKIPILLGHGFWSFSLRSLPYYGFWGFAHEGLTSPCCWARSFFYLSAPARGRSMLD